MNAIKLPPYGKSLAFQLATGKKPLFVPVCVGENCWERAETWLERDGIPPLVLPQENNPSDYRWVVEGCNVVVDAGEDVNDITLCELVASLLRANPINVTVWRSWSVNPIVKYSPEVCYVK
jgi:hypothetical protein